LKKLLQKIKIKLLINGQFRFISKFIALQCLINPYRKNRLKPGDEIIIPTLCWSTSLWPIIQSNLKPVFVDINKNTLNLDENSIEKK
jgi:CDP-6-deoxy-D-xylo-4-hexulose-3-dehydrase